MRARVIGDALRFFVPSNRCDARGRPTHVDGWNEYIRAVKRNRYVGASMERENLLNVCDYARAAMRATGYPPLGVPALVLVRFVEVNRRRDVPNVYGGLKWVLDGITRPRGPKLVGAGLIVDDSPAWCEAVPSLQVDRESPGVWIQVSPLREEKAANEEDCRWQ